MENKVREEFNLIYADISSMHKRFVHSGEFVIGSCKWKLMIYPKGILRNDFLSLYLEVANAASLSSGWRRHTRFSITVTNQHLDEHSYRAENDTWFDENKHSSGFESLFPLIKLRAENNGFLVNGKVKIFVEINVLEVIGELDVLQESEEPNQPSKRIKRRDSSLEKESVYVNRFYIQPSKVELVKRIYKKHPDIAAKFIFKDEYMRTESMKFLLSLVEILRKSIEKITFDDLAEADNALKMVKSAGFKSNWLEKKLEEVKENKKEYQNSVMLSIEVEVALKFHKKKCEDLESVMKIEKAKMLALKTSPTLDDII